jgi:hypothetical protein
VSLPKLTTPSIAAKQYAAVQAAFQHCVADVEWPELHFNFAVAERKNRMQKSVDHYRACLASRSDATDRGKLDERIAVLQTLP